MNEAMKLTEHQITEARNVYNLYWDSYLAGDVDAFASTLDENYEMIGTSEVEIAHNKAEGIAFFKSQMQEMAGKAEMRNRQISAKPVNEMLLINENCDIFVLAGTGWKESGYKPEVILTTKKHQNSIELSVKDNGPGIPDSIKDKIFQPFFTTKPTGQGSGLGLSLSYDIVKAHGGQLKVETKPSRAVADGDDPVGRGCEFIVLLPI
jgi:hypothetical protein